MTKIQLSFHLSAPLKEKQMSRIADLYSTYGILRINVAPSRQDLIVEYDGTRLTPDEVEAALARAGFPLAERSI